MWHEHWRRRRFSILLPSAACLPLLHYRIWHRLTKGILLPGWKWKGAVSVGGVGGTVTARGKQRIPFSDHSTALNAHLQRILIVWQIVRCSESTYKYAPNETTRQPTDRHSQIARKEANTCWMAKVSCNSNNDVQLVLLHIIQARVVAELKVWVILVTTASSDYYRYCDQSPYYRVIILNLNATKQINSNQIRTCHLSV